MQRQAIRDPGHAVLAHAEGDIAPAELARPDHGSLGEGCRIRAGEVRRAPDQRRHTLRNRVEDLPRGHTRRHRLRGAEIRPERGQVVGQAPLDHGLPELAQAPVSQGLGATLLPLAAQAPASFQIGTEHPGYVARELEGGEIPAEILARLIGPLVAESAMRRGGVDGGGALADLRLTGDEVRPVLTCHGLRECRADLRRIVPVHLLHLPAVGLVAAWNVLGERQAGRPVDGDAVVVIEHDQSPEA